MFDVLSRPNLRELQQLQLFQSVATDTIEGIIESFVVRRLKKNELLIAPGESNHYLYQVLSGRLRVHLESESSVPVCFVEPGEPVGELSIINKSVTTAFVVADDDCRLLLLDEALVWSLVEASHAFARNLLQSLSLRLRHANEVIAEKMRMEDFFYHYGTVDVLTGMHSRSWFDLIIDRALRRCTMQGKPFSLIMLDIDDFKTYNEKNGRLCSDIAINKIAATILRHLRVTEIAVRYGGDRMMVLLPETDLRQSRMVAERLRQQVMYADILAPDGRPLPSVTISIGIAQAEPEQTAEEFVEVVKVALQRAKEMGKNYVSD